jgi:hypothetical protein
MFRVGAQFQAGAATASGGNATESNEWPAQTHFCYHPCCD